MGGVCRAWSGFKTDSCLFLCNIMLCRGCLPSISSLSAARNLKLWPAGAYPIMANAFQIGGPHIKSLVVGACRRQCNSTRSHYRFIHAVLGMDLWAHRGHRGPVESPEVCV